MYMAFWWVTYVQSMYGSREVGAGANGDKLDHACS